MHLTEYFQQTSLKTAPSFPNNEKVLNSCYHLKKLGLVWEPMVGHYVHDRYHRIDAPSPFSNRIYFILNINRFLSIFESIENMKSQLIWIPTLYQLLQKLQELGLTDTDLLKLMLEKEAYSENLYYAALKLTEEILQSGQSSITNQ